jgi:hypothetical protein
MDLSQFLNRKSAICLGLICICGALYYFYGSSTRTAPPGQVPGVPPLDRTTEVLPSDGFVVPRLSDDEMKQVKNGGTVELKVPGGILKIGKVEPPKGGDL